MEEVLKEDAGIVWEVVSAVCAYAKVPKNIKNQQLFNLFDIRDKYNIKTQFNRFIRVKLSFDMLGFKLLI